MKSPVTPPSIVWAVTQLPVPHGDGFRKSCASKVQSETGLNVEVARQIVSCPLKPLTSNVATFPSVVTAGNVELHAAACSMVKPAAFELLTTPKINVDRTKAAHTAGKDKNE